MGEEHYYARLLQQGTMYAAMTKKVVQDAAVITCTILIPSAYELVLFYFGSTNTFLAKAFIEKVAFKSDDLDFDLVMSTLAGVVLITRECVSGIVVTI